LTLSNLL